jgi:hypothetical protein
VEPTDSPPPVPNDAAAARTLPEAGHRLSIVPPQPNRPMARVAASGGPPGPTPPTVAIPAAPSAPPESPITATYFDGFDRADLGAEWNATSPEWRIQGGRLCAQNAHNHPAWLKRKLPVNARIEFDASSSSPDGDLKVEVWGDGKSFAKGTSYNDATSYLAIFGGWKNQFHVLARIDEHATDRPQVKVDPSGADLKAMPVKPGRVYHFKVERADGKTIRWLVDDIEIITFTDPAPLKGDGHDHLGFNDWEVPVCFDNLQITSLGG